MPNLWLVSRCPPHADLSLLPPEVQNSLDSTRCYYYISFDNSADCSRNKASEKEYWMLCWDEFGEYDPSFYQHQHTRDEKLAFVRVNDVAYPPTDKSSTGSWQEMQHVPVSLLEKALALFSWSASNRYMRSSMRRRTNSVVSVMTSCIQRARGGAARSNKIPRESKTKWAEWGELLVSSLDLAYQRKLHVELGNRNQDTLSALWELHNQMLYFGRYVMLHTAAEYWRLASIKPVKKKNSGDFSRLYLAPIEFDSKKASVTERVVWLIRIQVLNDLIRRKEWGQIRDKGAWSYVASAPYMGNVCCDLCPPVHELPSDGLQSQPIRDGGERVVVLFLRDMHQEANVYRCFKATARRCDDSSEGRASASSSSSSSAYTETASRVTTCLRNWCALEPHFHHNTEEKYSKQPRPRDAAGVILSALGPPESRPERIRKANKAIGVEELSQEQEEVVITLKGNAVVNSFSGTGKTSLHKVLMHMAVNSKSPPLVFFGTEANFMAREMYESCTWLLNGEKLLLAVEDVNGDIKDHADTFLQTITQEFIEEELPVLELYDRLLVMLLPMLARSKGSVINQAAIKLCVWLHARRHLALFLNFYRQLRARQKEKIANLKVIFMTHSSLIKLHSNGHIWSKLLPDDRDKILLIDELQKRGAEEMMAMVTDVDAFIVMGDSNQGIWQSQRQSDLHDPVDQFFSHNESHSQVLPFLWNNSMAWAKKVAELGFLQYYSNTRTRRYGREVVDLQRTLFAERCSTLSSHPKAPHTKIVAVLFPQFSIDDWVESTKKGEVARSRTFFTVALVLVALECVLFRLRQAAKSERSTSSCVVLVAAFLWSFLDQLEFFFQQYFESMCKFIHDSICSSPDHRRECGDLTKLYKFSEWTQCGWLQFRAGQTCHHITARTVVAFWGKRRVDDKSYEGNQTQQHMIHSVTTRGSARIYIMMEDLRSEIIVPKTDSDLVEAAKELGLSEKQFVDRGIESVARRQLNLAQMFNHIGRLHDCYDLNALQDTSWRMALLHPSYLKSIHEDSDVFKQFSLPLKAILTKGVSRAETYYKDVKRWHASQRKDITTIKTQLLFPSANGSGNLPKTASAWNKIIAGTRYNDIGGRSAPVFKDYEEQFGTCKGVPNVMHASTAENTCVTWFPLLVDAITVSLWTEKQNPLCALVTLPVAIGLSRTAGDIQQLLCAICSKAYNAYTASEMYAAAKSQGKRVEPKVGWHKKERHIVAGFEYIVESCGSDRPAFCIIEEDGEGRREVCHFYYAMGLKRQHKHIASCLAKLYDFGFALQSA